MQLVIAYELADSFASSAASSSRNFIKDGGGLTTMLFFHSRSRFLDNLLFMPSSSSLSLLTVSMRATCSVSTQWQE